MAAKARGWVRFKTKRGRKVEFKLTGRGHRKTAWNRKFGAAGKACARSHKPGSHGMGKCVKAKLK
jgi:hypothetical protein